MFPRNSIKKLNAKTTLIFCVLVLFSASATATLPLKSGRLQREEHLKELRRILLKLTVRYEELQEYQYELVSNMFGIGLGVSISVGGLMYLAMRRDPDCTSGLAALTSIPAGGGTGMLSLMVLLNPTLTEREQLIHKEITELKNEYFLTLDLLEQDGMTLHEIDQFLQGISGVKPWRQ